VTDKFPYQDSELSVQRRTDDLMGRMSLEEQVGQLVQADGRKDAEQQVRERRVGSFLHILGEPTVGLQKLAAKTGLGIPIIFGIDAIHGHGFWPGATVFPTQLGMSCSWNPDLLEIMGRVTAREMLCTGLHWTFSPVLCLTRDLRWGRVGETFGEDPYLLGVLGSALVRGYQGKSLSDPDSVIACAKHFAGYSETVTRPGTLASAVARRTQKACA
jgi:beta-glucosidase